MVLASGARCVGARVQRVEDPRLLKGQGRYTDDLKLPGMLHLAFIRSAHAHGRLTAVDTSAAASLPGVAAVLTGADLTGRVRPLRSVLTIEGHRATDWPALAAEKVRFVGEPVAVVAAADRYLAEDAADLVTVAVEPFPAVVDGHAAMAPAAPVLHEAIGSNVLFSQRFATPGLALAFDSADVVIQETFRTGRVTGVPMENRAVVADFHPGTRELTVWSSTQIPHLLRTALAEVLDHPENLIRVIAPDVGGGFGIKCHVFVEEIVAAHLAMRLQRPVKWTEDRREEFLSSIHARDQVVEAAIAARSDGTVLGIRAKVIVDVGAYAVYPFGACIEPLGTAKALPGPYRMGDLGYETYGVATNECPVGPYRGVAQPVATLVTEQLMDRLACRLGLDPAELRRRNLICQEDMPWRTAGGALYESGTYQESLARALEVVGYERLRAEQKRRRPDQPLLGIGLCCFAEVSGVGSRGYKARGMSRVPGFDSCTIKVEPTGKVRLMVSICSQGQSHETTMAQICADELGIPMSDVTVVAGDTSLTPYGTGTFASRGALSGGASVILAAQGIREKMLSLVGHLLEVSPTDLELADGEVRVKGAPGRSLSFRRVSEAAYLIDYSGPLPAHIEPGLEVTRYYDPPPATYSNASHIAVVEVDRETAVVKVLDYVVVEDCGNIINPMVVDGQIQGGIAQGLGGVLLENLVYDASGQLLSASLMDYLVPTAAEMPPVRIEHMVSPSPANPGGYKGMGEGGTIGAYGAIAGAVSDALALVGASVRSLPISPAEVYSALSRSS